MQDLTPILLNPCYVLCSMHFAFNYLSKANFFMDDTESQFLKPDHGVLPQFSID